MHDSVPAAPLRQLSVDDSPMGGALMPGVPPHVRTDAAAWEGNPGWVASPGSHVLAPLDAGFDDRGVCIFVPHCPMRLLSLLDMRAGLTAGEAVTVTVSILRGASEAHALGAENGVWWVASDGRPLVATAGNSPWADEGVEILARVAELSRALPADLLVRATTAITDPRRLGRDLPELEEALFLVAEPLALVTEMVSPRRQTAPASPLDVASDAGARESLVFDFVRRHVDTAWADRVYDAWTTLRTRALGRAAHPGARSSDAAGTGRRRTPRPMMLGCVAAAAVLGLGLSWPDPPPDDAAAREKTAPAWATVGGRSASGAPSPAATTSPRPQGGDRLSQAAARLVKEFADCVEAGCGSQVVEEQGRTFPSGPATDADADRRVEIIDDYGGVVAVRVSAENREQIAVMVQSGQKWLIRDIYDVADQPE